jgi:hypothetical protein
MKRTSTTKHSLFTAKHRGGVVAGTGFNFQDAFIVTMLPRWLCDPAFRSLLKEGFDDVDVMFAGADGPWTWHYQLKDHEVGVAELRGILADFAVSAGRPGANATRFTLGCCGLAAKLRSLWQRIVEFRSARTVHSAPALAATRDELLADLAKHKLAAHAELLLNQVEIDYETAGLRDVEPQVLRERFRGSFISLQVYRNQPAALIDRVFTALMVSVNKGIRRGISREELESMIGAELSAATKGRAVVVYLHGWIRQAYDVPPDQEIDWTEHFDHITRRVPAPAVWDHELLPSLRALRARFDGEPGRRLIWLRSRAPLSAGFAFGHAFAEAAGYSLQIQQSTPGATESLQYWETDVPIEHEERLLAEEVGGGDPAAEEVLVAIGMTDDPRPKVEQYVSSAGLKVAAALYLYPAAGPSATAVSARTAGAFAAALKRDIRAFCNRRQASAVHVFYVGPLGLAVLLGQKMNGLPDIQCYEQSKTTGYTPSCRLSA